MPIGHGVSFWLVLESHGKVMENDFPKRVVTLSTSLDCFHTRVPTSYKQYRYIYPTPIYRGWGIVFDLFLSFFVYIFLLSLFLC